MLARRYLWYRPKRLQIYLSTTCPSSTKSTHTQPLTDELGLPLSPPWSVHALISSYPSPTLSNATLTRLHDLAALAPPAQDTREFEELKKDMEVLVKLVGAVRLAPEEAREDKCPPDGRVWPKDRGIAVGDAVTKQDDWAGRPPSGRELLIHAQRTKGGYYLVDSLKTKI